MSTAPDFQHADDLGAAAADDFQPNAGVQAVKGIQIRREKLGSHRIAGADDQCAQQKLLGLGEFVLSVAISPRALRTY